MFLQILISALTLVSCSSLIGRKVEIRSVPAGAEVLAIGGDKLGVTPLVLSGPTLQRAAPAGRIEVKLVQPGFIDRELILDAHGDDKHNVRLSPLDADYFVKHALSEFSKPVNSLVRQLLQIQGLVVAKKLDQAKQALDEFQLKYPNIASSYVLMANVDLLRGKKAAARINLLRAKTLDPTDPVIGRMLAGTGDKGD